MILILIKISIILNIFVESVKVLDITVVVARTPTIEKNKENSWRWDGMNRITTLCHEYVFADIIGAYNHNYCRITSNKYGEQIVWIRWLKM